MSFKKLICNLLLGVHPICVDKWSHPILLQPIHKFYLNRQTIYTEYKKSDKYDYLFASIDDDINVVFYTYIQSEMQSKISSWLLNNYIDIHYQNDELLRIAVYQEHLKTVKWVLSKKANPYAQDGYSIRKSALDGNIEMIKLLLPYYVDEQKNKYKQHLYIAFKLAASNNHIEISKLLLSTGIDIHNIQHCLLEVSYKGYTELVQLLLSSGADAHVGNDMAIQLAAENGHLEIVRLLLNNTVYDIAIYNYVIQDAYDNNHYKIVALLLKHKIASYIKKWLLLSNPIYI